MGLSYLSYVFKLNLINLTCFICAVREPGEIERRILFTSENCFGQLVLATSVPSSLGTYLTSLVLIHNQSQSTMAIEPYSVDLDPDTNTTLKVYLFKNVENVEEIRKNIIKSLWKCAVIKPSLIVDPFQLTVASNKAVMAEKLNLMLTRTVYTEILFNLSLSKNISQSLCKFGIEKERELLVCFLVRPDSDNSKDIISQIDGELCPISELSNFTNLKELKQVYKLNNLKCESEIVDLVVSKMVTKGFVSH